MLEGLKLPSEEFLLPVSKFNDAVGPLFAALHNKFPLDDHYESGLLRSLGIFLNFCFERALNELQTLRPEPISREQWIISTPEEKAPHLKWQSNLLYLKHRNAHFTRLMRPVVEIRLA